MHSNKGSLLGLVPCNPVTRPPRDPPSLQRSDASTWLAECIDRAMSYLIALEYVSAWHQGLSLKKFLHWGSCCLQKVELESGWRGPEGGATPPTAPCCTPHSRHLLLCLLTRLLFLPILGHPRGQACSRDRSGQGLLCHLSSSISICAHSWE